MTEADIVVTLSESWMQAIGTNRVSEIEPYMTDDWLLVTPQAGPITKQQFLEAIGSSFLVHDDMRSEGEPYVRVFGHTAVLVSRVRNRGTYQGEPFTYDEWSTDTFVKTDDRWRCVLTALTPVQGESA